MSPLPTLDQVRSLPLDRGSEDGGGSGPGRTVPARWVDANGHMNILRYVEESSYAVWRAMEAFGAGERYIAERGLSFFTVGHHIDYLGELREGESFAVHTGFVERTAKAVRAAAFFVDPARERLSCRFEATYVHVSMQTRRAEEMPDDVAAGIDEAIAASPWLPPLVTGLSLRR